jgi:hypothetical protein
VWHIAAPRTKQTPKPLKYNDSFIFAKKKTLAQGKTTATMKINIQLIRHQKTGDIN